MRAIASSSLLCRTAVGAMVASVGVYSSMQAQGTGASAGEGGPSRVPTAGTGGRGRAGETVLPGTATATIGGRQISATADGPISVQGDGANATLKLASHVVRVERQRILIDGKERAKLPASVTRLHVTEVKGRLRITADGAEVVAWKE